MKYVVTGVSGFVGGALAKRLAKNGHTVVGISRRGCPDLVNEGVTSCQLDLTSDVSTWGDVFKGAHAVFHVAAKVDMWGRYQDFFAANVEATRNIIKACRENSIKNLVFTSSPSVVADGNSLMNIDETYPYPKSFEAFYPRTKALAEKEILEANGEDLRTISLRPHLIFGPGDVNFVPTIIERAKKGRLIRVGNGSNLVDLSYIDDCIAAHILAAEALEKNPRSRGQAYFISQGTPVFLWGWIDQVLGYNGLPRVKRSISTGLALLIARISESFAKLFRSREPFLTRFLAHEMATSHYFNIRAAREELGYVPSCSVDEATVRMWGNK